MKFKVFIVSVFFVCCLFPGISLAQNKVVVIPLMEDTPPHEPYAPLAAVSPPDSAYSTGAYGVIDIVTGLYWQKPANTTPSSWEDAWDYCQNLSTGLGGYYDDYRLPSVEELMSIVHYGTHQPAINTVAFPAISFDQPYWSTTASTTGSGFALAVGFIYGGVDSLPKSYGCYIRCVRRLSPRDSVFENNGNGTVTDLATGRTWQRQDDNTQRTWAEANTYCQSLSLGGKTDWRLPNIKELRSIVDDRVSDPAIDKGAFVGTNWHYWSATTLAYGSGGAWSVDFYNGPVRSGSSSNPNYVRCVR